jgi:sugar phosphate isomerase/epimerase
MKSSAAFTLSAFGDEIADDLREQVAVLKDLRIGYLELRGVWGKNVLYLNDGDVVQVEQVLSEAGMAVSCIGSPVGKSPIVDPIDVEMSNLTRIFGIGESLNVRRVRIFSFYPPDMSTNVHYDEHLEAATSRLARLTGLAQKEGFRLLLENEKAIVGDTLERCYAIVSTIDSPHLRFLWDPANFVQVDEAESTERGWASLGPYVDYVHVKDAVLADGSIRPAGEGDGQVGELLTRLRKAGYQGFLALEPHLVIAGHSSGHSGVDGMTRAVEALRDLMTELHCAEVPARFKSV